MDAAADVFVAPRDLLCPVNSKIFSKYDLGSIIKFIHTVS